MLMPQSGQAKLWPDKSVSLEDGAITVLGWQSSGSEGSFTNAILQALAKEFKFSLKILHGIRQTTLDTAFHYKTVHHDFNIVLDIFLNLEIL